MPKSDIQQAQERIMSVFKQRPEAALSSIRAEATISDGLVCTVKEGNKQAILDMPEAIGGTATGPTPGFHARAAISGCIALGIKMTAERLGIKLASVKVAVDMDFDDSAVLGMGTASAAPLKTRVQISLDSEAEPAILDDLVETALAADPYYLALRDPQIVETHIERI